MTSDTVHLTTKEAAEYLGVSAITIRRWTNQGVLPCWRTPGGQRRIRVEDLDTLASSQPESRNRAVRT